MNKTALLLTAAVLLVAALVSGGSTAPMASAQLGASVPPALSWAKSWGGNSADGANNVAVDGSGNLYVVGSFQGVVDLNPDPTITATYTSNGVEDVFLVKFDTAGTLQWARTWGGPGRDVAVGLAVDGLGNIDVCGPFQYTVDFDPGSGILTGTSNAGNLNNIFVSQFDADGNLHWVRNWGPSDGGAEGYSVAVDGSNNVYVAGDFSGSGAYFNPWGSGDQDWHDNYGTPPRPPWAFDAYISKFDVNGSWQWSRTWGGEGYDDGPAVVVDGAGNVYSAGMYASIEIDFDPGPGVVNLPAHDSGFVVDVFLSKFDADGNFLWVKTWGGQGTDDVAGTMIVDTAGNLYVGGRFASVNCDFNPWGQADLHSTHGGHDAWLSKFDASGTFQWAKTWGGTDWDTTTGLAVDGANNLYVAGAYSSTTPVDFDPDPAITETCSTNGVRDAFLSRFDAGPTGTFQWAKCLGGSGEDWAFDVAVGGAGSAYLVGSFSDIVNFGGESHTSNGQADAFLVKFLPLSLPYAVYLPFVSR